MSRNFYFEDGVLTVFITDQCNQTCMTCPQELGSFFHRPGEVERGISAFELDHVTSCYFTGGEPMLHQESIFEALEVLPDSTKIFILTNGTIVPTSRLLLDSRVVFCVSLYSSQASVHNRIVGADSWTKVISNLYEMGASKVQIELRVVLGKYNSGHIAEFGRFIAMNLPFLNQVSWMGMELVEMAELYADRLWVTPRLLVPQILDAIALLDAATIPSLIYNFPLCLFPPSARDRVRKTISNWKVRFLRSCHDCEMMHQCGGFFMSNVSVIEDEGVHEYE